MEDPPTSNRTGSKASTTEKVTYRGYEISDNKTNCKYLQ